MEKETKEDIKWVVEVLIIPLAAFLGLGYAAKKGIEKMLAAGGWSFFLVIAAAVALGVFVGMAISTAMGIREARKARAEADEEGRQRKQRLADALAKKYEHMEFHDKAFIKSLYRNGESCAYEPFVDDSEDEFAEYSVSGPGRRRWRISKAAKDLFDSRPELLDFIDPDVEDPFEPK